MKTVILKSVADALNLEAAPTGLTNNQWQIGYRKVVKEAYDAIGKASSVKKLAKSLLGKDVKIKRTRKGIKINNKSDAFILSIKVVSG